MKKLVALLILLQSIHFGQTRLNELTGNVTDKNNGEPLFGCNITVLNHSIGTVTDDTGTFKIKLRAGKYILRFSYVGYKSVDKKISVYNGAHAQQLNVSLQSKIIEVKDVTVTAKQDLGTTISQKIEYEEIKRLPKIYNDALRSVKILPGVTSNNELSSGYNVRGGTFDENLIYLNGYEIYRPFLLQMGVEENQSLVNQDLMKDMEFYNGTFPAHLGDKLSSALKINYEDTPQSGIKGTARASLINAAVSLKTAVGNLSIVGGVRYSYPGLFLNGLQTSGSYEPAYRDVQALIRYRLSKKSELELFIVDSYNKYNLLPEEWLGHFRSDIGTADVSQITGVYDGNQSYRFNTNLYGLKNKHSFSENTMLVTSASYYKSNESEKEDLIIDYYFSPDANNPEVDKEYLKNRREITDNSFSFERWNGSVKFLFNVKEHKLNIGADYKSVKLKETRDEFIYETGSQTLFNKPIDMENQNSFSLNSFSSYLEDNFEIGKRLKFNAGIRYTFNEFTDENLVSPRFSMQYFPSDVTKLSFSYGHYYQPPFFFELRGKDYQTAKQLKSQQSIHYAFGWEYQFKKTVKFQAELYYKNLNDLIPFYLDQMKLVYNDRNNAQGFAYGMDLQFQGQVTKGMQSWISYSFLDTKEKLDGDDKYYRRILDQSHTVQIFLQDKIRKHPNWQSHLRLLFGTGFLFYDRRSVVNEETGQSEIEVLWDQREEFSHYMRADMGLSASFDVGNTSKLIVVAEVLNVFNNYNFSGYTWIQVLKSINAPFRIPQIFSKRFFNLSVELAF